SNLKIGKKNRLYRNGRRTQLFRWSGRKHFRCIGTKPTNSARICSSKRCVWRIGNPGSLNGKIRFKCCIYHRKSTKGYFEKIIFNAESTKKQSSFYDSHGGCLKRKDSLSLVVFFSKTGS